MQRLWTPVPGHLSSYSALSSYGLFAPLTLWRLTVSVRPLVQTLRSCPASGAPWSSAMPPCLGRGRVTNNNNNNRKNSQNGPSYLVFLQFYFSQTQSLRYFKIFLGYNKKMCIESAFLIDQNEIKIKSNYVV